MQDPDKKLGKCKNTIEQWQVNNAEWTLKKRDEALASRRDEALASRSKDDDPHQHASSGSGLPEELRIVPHRSHNDFVPHRSYKDIDESGIYYAGFEWKPWMKEEFKFGEHMKPRHKRLCCRAGCN